MTVVHAGRDIAEAFLAHHGRQPEKVTSAPAPPLVDNTLGPEMVERQKFRQFTDPQFKFGREEPKDTAIYLANPAMADGYEFVQPLYSSFCKGKVYVPPKLPPRPRNRPNRPSTTPGGSRSRGRPEAPPQLMAQQQSGLRGETIPSSAPAGMTGGMGPQGSFGAYQLPARPGTAQNLKPLSMASLTIKGARGSSASTVRSGGFQLLAAA